MFAAPERASNKKLAAGKMDKRKIPARFEKSDVVNPHNPRLDIVGQENKIVAIKQISWLVSFTHRIERRQPLRFFPECHYQRRMIAGLWLRKHSFNSSSMQSGENLIDSYGRTARKPTVRSSSHDKLNSCSPDFRRVARQ